MRIMQVLTLLALLVSAAPVQAADWAPAGGSASSELDWPQLGRDAQRSNAAPLAVRGPYRFYWRWTGVPIASRVQPVVVAGRLYVGSLNGTLYALDAGYDARGGAPRLLWQRDLGSPIRAGAAVEGGIVVVGVQHGMIYGLDAASGTLRWSLATGGAIVAAPLVANGMAYLGSADGHMYALRVRDGSLRWAAEIGAPVLGSAALSRDGATLFLGAEDMRAYALATRDGSLRWRAQLQGQSSSDRWPVVAGDTAFFRTMPVRFFHDLIHDGDEVLDSAGALRPDPRADWAAVQPKIVGYLRTHPADQTLFALDITNGRSRGVAPVLYTFGTNDPPTPPVVIGGSPVLAYRARHGIQNDSGVAVHVTSRYDAELGHLNPNSLDIAAVASSTPFAYQFRLTSDEPAVLSAAGDMLLVDNWERLGGVDLKTGALVGVAQVAWDYPECWVHCEANDTLMPFFEQYPFTQQRPGEGNARAGAVIAAGRIFWKASGSGLAAIGPGVALLPKAAQIAAQPVPLPSSASLPDRPARALSDAQLRSYVWDVPAPAQAPRDLALQLDREIGLIVARDQHLLPLALERGFHGAGSWPPDTAKPPGPATIHNSEVYWFNPGELVMTLARAYPYLGAARQSQVRAYLRAEMQRFAPLEPLPYPPASWLSEGRARELYQVGDRHSWNSWPPPDTPVQTLYALWAYGYYTGDWDYLGQRWDAIEGVFEARKSAIDSYARIAGAIGYARIARQLGHPQQAAQGEAAALAAMRAGLDFATWRERANLQYPDPRDIVAGQRGQPLWGLTPEVGRYLADSNRAAVDVYLESVIGEQHGSYLWYVTRLGTQAERGESSFHSPELAWSVFLAQAYIRGASQAQLRRWLDRPWALGDVWYIQKVLATIEAG
jgi:hypothetical protein